MDETTADAGGQFETGSRMNEADNNVKDIEDLLSRGILFFALFSEVG